MFIYFPEFLYRRTVAYIENTFKSSSRDKEKYEISIHKLLSYAIENNYNKNDSKEKNFKSKKSSDHNIFDPKTKFSECFNDALKENISLPKIELIHCNKFYDYLSDVTPSSEYNFSDNKIKICINKLENCLKDKKSIFKGIENPSENIISKYLLPYSKYNNSDYNDTIKVRNFQAIFLKEFSYFYDYNKTYNNKKITLNEKAKMTIQACKYEVLAKLKLNPNEFNINQRNNTKNLLMQLQSNLNNELVKRCAYLELKYKFFDDLEFENSKENESNINELARKYVDSNFF